MLKACVWHRTTHYIPHVRYDYPLRYHHLTLIMLQFITLTVCLISLFIATIFGCVVLWLHQPHGSLSIIAAMMLIILAVITLVLLWLKSAWMPMGVSVLTAALLATLVWYLSITPSNDRHWHDEYAHLLDFTHTDNQLRVYHVRNFSWHSETDYTPNWQIRHYDLHNLERVDLITSVWGNPNIAHTLFSFGFSDGAQLAFSVETRREADEVFSSIGGFFRQFELIVIAADEKDIIYTRTSIRHHDDGSLGEDVHIYPLTLDKNQSRKLLLDLLDLAVQLKTSPRWYHTLGDNCTTAVVDLMRQLPDVTLPLDYRIFASAKLPAYFYQHGLIDNRLPLSTWHTHGALTHKMPNIKHIHRMPSEDFSRLMRADLPKLDITPIVTQPTKTPPQPKLD